MLARVDGRGAPELAGVQQADLSETKVKTDQFLQDPL
jgi:hypothetical protein